MAKKQWTPEEIEKQVREKPTDRRFIDMEGRKLGRITVGRYCGRCLSGSRWECHCECGRVYITSYAVLKNPTNRSCGCYHDEVCGKATITHGMSRTPEFEIWLGIKDRCFCTTDHAYGDYGGRGITMHPTWVESFEQFYKDVGPRPSPQHTIDRYPNNNGNYEPGNVRWATKKQQANNRRSNRMITVNGVTKTLMQWGESTGFGWGVIKRRLDMGWDEESAVTTPVRVPKLPTGVTRSASRFRARLSKRHFQKDVGYFDTIEEAVAAHKQAELEYAKSVANSCQSAIRSR